MNSKWVEKFFQLSIFKLIQIDPNTPTDRFPLEMEPALNASLTDRKKPIRFSLFPARIGDPTEGLELDPESGTLRVHSTFLDAALRGAAARNSTEAEVFIVVRAYNVEQPAFFSDVSVALLIRRSGEAMLTLYSHIQKGFD